MTTNPRTSEREAGTGAPGSAAVPGDGAAASTGRPRTHEVRCDGGVAGPTEPVTVDGIDEFAALTAAHPLVLVEFRADWCGPCRALEPVLESIARDTDAVVATVDVEANRELAFAHRARSLPTIECYRDGDRVERLVGAPSERELRDLLRAHGG